MSTYTPTARTRTRLRPDRGSYDAAVVHRIIDEALVCHLGFVLDGKPCVIPTTILRIGEHVYLHGSTGNRALQALSDGAEACICVTHVDAVVAGRSGFGCSVDYRSVVIYARGEKVEGDQKEAVIDAVIQSVIPGHKVRRAKPSELDQTLVLRFPLVEVSAKVRDCGVRDLEPDYDLDLWAGVIPLELKAGPPRDDPRLKPTLATPDYALNYRRR